MISLISIGNEFQITEPKYLKGNAQFVQKVTFEPLMVSNKTIIKVENITKAASFESFLYLSYKNTQALFL